MGLHHCTALPATQQQSTLEPTNPAPSKQPLFLHPCATHPPHPPPTPHQGVRSVLSFAGLIADSEDLQITGAPEFGLALRTQLLVGGGTYAIQEQPEYAAAFGGREEDAGDGEVKVRGWGGCGRGWGRGRVLIVVVAGRGGARAECRVLG